MNKWVKKSIPLFVATTMAFSLIPNGVDAKSDNGKDNGKGNGQKIGNIIKNKAKKNSRFKDVEKHWANQDIYKLYSIGIMSGYEDFTYQPNKPVTQLEAISSFVRVLELDGSSRNPSLSNKDLKDIPSWARTTVAIAIEEELLDNTKKFQPNKPATRLFITNLLVKLVGKDFEENWDDDHPLFKDIDDLSKQEKEILALATLLNLINGYSDQTFKPNKPVTRAEMAVLINRLLDYKDDHREDYEESTKGTIESIDVRDLEITIKQRVKVNGEWKDTTKKYDIDDDAKIYVDGKAATLSKLEEDMIVEFSMDDEDDDIIYIKAKSVPDEDVDEEDEEIKDLLKQLGKLTKIDLEIEGDDDDEIYVFFERENSNQTEYDAKIKVDTNKKSFTYSGKTALTYLASFIDDENIDFSEEDQSEASEFIHDLIREYEVEDAEIDGMIVINDQTYRY